MQKLKEACKIYDFSLILGWSQYWTDENSSKVHNFLENIAILAQGLKYIVFNPLVLNQLWESSKFWRLLKFFSLIPVLGHVLLREFKKAFLGLILIGANLLFGQGFTGVFLGFWKFANIFLIRISFEFVVLEEDL